MSTTLVSGVNRSHAAGLSPDVGELDNLPQRMPGPAVSRAQLLPGAEATSLLPVGHEAPSATAPLTRFLGPLLTVANPAWTGNPVPCMRALQKRLVEHSLTLAEADRSECMAAISVVELAVRLRLRLQQMRMNAVEMDIKPDSVTTQ